MFDSIKKKETLIIDNINYSQIKQSPIHGYGLFATQDILKNSILGTLDGQLISWNNYEVLKKELFKLCKLTKNCYDYFFIEWNALSKESLLVRAFRTKYSFINHSIYPNLKIIKLGSTKLEIKTCKNIQKGEEFLLNYRDEPLRKEYLMQNENSYLLTMNLL